MKGLDISSYQSEINFDVIKSGGVEFLIIRAGFTGWGTGINYNKDKYFEEFYDKSKSHNISVGAYWYSCANTKEKGIAEAKFMYDNCLKGKQFEYPIYIDIEDTHHQVNNKRGVTDAIIGFCETLENLGYYVGIYGSDISSFKEKMYLNELNAYDKWVARYGSKPKYVKSYGIWQSSSSGKIKGYNKEVDIDVSYKDYSSIIKNGGFNGFSKNRVEIGINTDFKIGDNVKIVKTGKSSSKGEGAIAYGIGFKRQILKIYNDKEYAYQVGNNSGTTGFYKKDALEKI